MTSLQASKLRPATRTTTAAKNYINMKSNVEKPNKNYIDMKSTVERLVGGV